MDVTPKILKKRVLSNKPTRKDLFIRLTVMDLEQLCVAMGHMAWEIAEARDVHRALVQLQRGAADRIGVSVSTVPWKYETITPMARLALQLYATGLFPLTEAVRHTHPGVSPGKVRGIARVLLRKVQERHPATVRAMEEGYLSMKTPLDQLADARLEAAVESMAFLRKCLTDDAIPAEDRIKVAQDFLDRTPDTAKVSKNETKSTQIGGVQMPAETAARLAQAAERASRYLLRSPEELTHAARGTDLHTIPEADAVPLLQSGGPLAAPDVSVGGSLASDDGDEPGGGVGAGGTVPLSEEPA